MGNGGKEFCGKQCPKKSETWRQGNSYQEGDGNSGVAGSAIGTGEWNSMEHGIGNPIERTDGGWRDRRFQDGKTYAPIPPGNSCQNHATTVGISMLGIKNWSSFLI